VKGYRILVDDPSGRWKKGDIGTELPLNNPDYSIFLDLGPTPGQVPEGAAPLLALMERKFHFHGHEVEPV
jgi:hypothetical protein